MYVIERKTLVDNVLESYILVCENYMVIYV